MPDMYCPNCRQMVSPQPLMVGPTILIIVVAILTSPLILVGGLFGLGVWLAILAVLIILVPITSIRHVPRSCPLCRSFKLVATPPAS